MLQAIAALEENNLIENTSFFNVFDLIKLDSMYLLLKN